MSAHEKRGLEMSLATHTAPALMGIKCANLISVPIDEAELNPYLNKLARTSRLRMRVLCKCESKVLVYVYHELMLNMQLSRPEIKRFLKRYGYRDDMTRDEMLTLLSERVKCGSFPHEIGIFLGYPLEDVEGFIKNKGKNFLICGCWKVYGNVEDARKTFEAYGRCRDILCDKLKQGFDLFQALKISKEELI